MLQLFDDLIEDAGLFTGCLANAGGIVHDDESKNRADVEQGGVEPMEKTYRRGEGHDQTGVRARHAPRGHQSPDIDLALTNQDGGELDELGQGQRDDPCQKGLVLDH